MSDLRPSDHNGHDSESRHYRPIPREVPAELCLLCGTPALEEDLEGEAS